MGYEDQEKVMTAGDVTLKQWWTPGAVEKGGDRRTFRKKNTLPPKKPPHVFNYS